MKILKSIFVCLFIPLVINPAFSLTPFEATQEKLYRDERRSELEVQLANKTKIEAGATHRTKMLSAGDVQLYQDIFRLQEKGQMRKANRKIAQLEDKLLLGHVYYQRYMHPTAYRSSYGELKRWLKHYSDHPGANKIYRMARKRGTSYGLVTKKAPYVPDALLQQNDAEHLQDLAEVKQRARWGRHEYNVYRKISHHIGKEQPSYAYQYLHKQKGKMSSRAQALSLVLIAKGYFLFGGFDDKVLQVAQHGIAIDEQAAPLLHWWAGMAAWRQGSYLQAGHHFRKLTFAKNVSATMIARSAVWAARSLMQTGFFDEVSPLLEHAAKRPFTLYGQLASEMLGYRVSYRWDWAQKSAGSTEDEIFFSYPAARRALALYELGDGVRASREFRAIIQQLPTHSALRYIQYVGESDFASLALDIGRKLNNNGVRVNSALFPVPKWQPEDGFRLKPALIFGFIRQESTFKPNALSVAGASGLMQLMPATAKFITRNKVQKHKIFTPEYNMSLGQRYIESLMGERYIKNNLFFTAVSYNGGPGNFRRWKRKMDYRDDPLLFLETIPSYETRHFTNAVVLNYWVYADRLGKGAKSREQLAQGLWPIYQDGIVGVDDGGNSNSKNPVIKRISY